MKEKKDWTGNKKSTFVTLGASNHTDHSRAWLDFYATSPTAITRLLEKHQIPRMPIWEIMAGEGNLEKPLEAAGYSVITSDIVERREKLDYVEDFFTTTELRAPIILTNPAYSIAMETVLHSVELGAEYIYMFLKTTFLEGQKRYEQLFSLYPPKEIWVFSGREQCAINNDEREFQKSSAASYSWFIWEKGFRGNPTVHWI